MSPNTKIRLTYNKGNLSERRLKLLKAIHFVWFSEDEMLLPNNNAVQSYCAVYFGF